MAELLFETYTTHVIISCWSCKHEVQLLPGDAPEGIRYYDFQRRAKCSKCGTTWPHIHQHPRPPSKWGAR